MENNTHKPNSETHKHESKTSPTDIFSSAQVVAEAAMAGFRRDTNKIDKGKAAGAAADILHAASHYGKLEEKSLGKYIEKAEDYLHQYHSSHSISSIDTSSKPTKPTVNSTNQQSTSDNYASSKPHSSSSQQSIGKKKKEKEEDSEGGFGGYVKLAEGFLGKQSGAHSSGGGVGEYVKLAHGLMKKH